jgi:hypothetical protein
MVASAEDLIGKAAPPRGLRRDAQRKGIVTVTAAPAAAALARLAVVRLQQLVGSRLLAPLLTPFARAAPLVATPRALAALPKRVLLALALGRAPLAPLLGLFLHPLIVGPGPLAPPLEVIGALFACPVGALPLPSLGPRPLAPLEFIGALLARPVGALPLLRSTLPVLADFPAALLPLRLGAPPFALLSALAAAGRVAHLVLVAAAAAATTTAAANGVLRTGKGRDRGRQQDRQERGENSVSL